MGSVSMKKRTVRRIAVLVLLFCKHGNGKLHPTVRKVHIDQCKVVEKNIHTVVLAPLGDLYWKPGDSSTSSLIFDHSWEFAERTKKVKTTKKHERKREQHMWKLECNHRTPTSLGPRDRAASVTLWFDVGRDGESFRRGKPRRAISNRKRWHLNTQ